MKKRITVIILIIVAILIATGITVFAVTTDNFNLIELLSNEDSTEPITEPATEKPTELPIEKPTLPTEEPTIPEDNIRKISKEGQRQLEKYEEYAIHDVAFGMSKEDLEITIGNFDVKFDNTLPLPYVRYENMYLMFDEDDGYMGCFIIFEGEYLGLTIGKSTKEDADRIFGFGSHEKDLYGKARISGEQVPEDEEKYYASDYFQRNGIHIVVFFEYNVVSAIEVVEISPEWRE